jgi:DNA mismatch repair protein MutL
MTIQLLDEQTAAKIAAGEVIVDPAAAVKELVENAMDAKATAITISIEDGGKAKIEVVDNGTGIEFEEVELAFARHGTSKIRTLEDLDRLDTLGFRGEALASIAAVASVVVKTSPSNDGLGTWYRRQGDQVTKKRMAYPRGTSVSVEHLFYNTPARLKHLKKSNEENRKIIRIVQVLAMSHPDISFTLMLDGAVYMKTPGTGDLLLVLQSIFGDHVGQEWISSTFTNEPLQLDGFLGSPYESKRNRDYQYLFINNRYIQEPRIQKAVEEAYEDLLMNHQHPAFVLHITLPSAMLDVNIHPSKTKVMVRNDSLFILLLKDGIRQILRRNLQGKKTIAPPPKNEERVFHAQMIPDAIQIQESLSGFMVSENDPKRKRSSETPASSENGTSLRPAQNIVSLEAVSIERTLSQPNQTLTALLQGTTYLGQLFSTYIMLEKESSSLILIDQHAAHERILYEKMMTIQADKPMESQGILPVTYRLSPDKYALLMNNMETFEGLGFDLAAFGHHQVVVRSVPMLLGEPTPSDLLLDILENEGSETGTLRERVILAACKKAVKAHQKMNREEIQTLMDRLLACTDPFTCPHGRPIVLTMDKYAIEKWFKRVL